jgi:hypothetical protein
VGPRRLRIDVDPQLGIGEPDLLDLADAFDAEQRAAGRLRDSPASATSRIGCLLGFMTTRVGSSRMSSGKPRTASRAVRTSRSFSAISASGVSSSSSIWVTDRLSVMTVV